MCDVPRAFSLRQSPEEMDSTKRRRTAYRSQVSESGLPDVSSSLHHGDGDGIPSTFVPSASPLRAPIQRQARASSIIRRDTVSIGQLAEDDLDQIVAAIDMKDGGTVGCSYYSAQEKRLYLLGDIQHANSETIETCKSYIVSPSPLLADLFPVIIQVKPTVLLTSTRIDHSSSNRQPPEHENGS